MYKAGPLISWAMEFLDAPNVSDIERLHERSVPWKKLRHALKDVRVTFVTTTGYPRMRKIRDLCLKAGRQTFPFTDRNDGSISHPTVDQYYTSRNRRLNHCDIFGVYVNDDKSTLIPAEFCEIVPGQRYMRQLAEAQQTQMVRTATVKPGDRIRHIRQAVAGEVSCSYRPVMSAKMIVDTSSWDTPVLISYETRAPTFAWMIDRWRLWERRWPHLPLSTIRSKLKW
ncbi:PAZ domain-containing protein [Amylostereum chailletii]|nr:PAZ domain-containing protein [Amylostereum chailletii]